MDARSKRRDTIISSLNTAVEAMNFAKELSSVTPAEGIFEAVGVILTMIRDSMNNEADYVELGLACAEVCAALDRGLSGKKSNDLNSSVYEAINQLTTTVTDIQRKIIKQGKRSVVSRLVHAKSDKEMISAWRTELARILSVFNTELATNTPAAVSDTHPDIHQDTPKAQEEPSGQHLATHGGSVISPISEPSSS